MNIESGIENPSVALATQTDETMNLHQKLVIIILDILMIVELSVSIHFANLNPESFTPIFVKYFFAMLIPTLIAAKILVRKLRTKEPVIPE